MYSILATYFVVKNILGLYYYISVKTNSWKNKQIDLQERSLLVGLYQIDEYVNENFTQLLEKRKKLNFICMACFCGYAVCEYLVDFIVYYYFCA